MWLSLGMSTEGERCTGAQSIVVVPVPRGYGADLVGVDLPVDRGLREGEHGLERGEERERMSRKTRTSTGSDVWRTLSALRSSKGDWAVLVGVSGMMAVAKNDPSIAPYISEC